MRYFSLFCIFAIFSGTPLFFTCCASSLKQLNTFTLVPQHEALGTNKKTPLFSHTRFIKTIQHRKKQPISFVSMKDSLQMKRVFDAYPGIPKLPDAKHIAIFSRGYIPFAQPRNGSPRIGGGIQWISRMVQQNILADSIWVAFDFNDNALDANFGTGIDVDHLQQIVSTVSQKNPDAQIVLLGDCRGAHAILRQLIYHENKAVTSIVLESPYMRVQSLFDQVADSYVQPYLGRFGKKVFKLFSRWFFPKLDTIQEINPSQLNLIQGKRIFIGHHLLDEVISDECIAELVYELSRHNEVYLFLTSNPAGDHSRLSLVPDYQKALNAFLDLGGFNAHQILAQEGGALLRQAKLTTTLIAEHYHCLHAKSLSLTSLQTCPTNSML